MKSNAGLIVTMAASACCYLAAAASAEDFWTLDNTGRLTHQFTAAQPLVLCMQGRKVVMQTQADGKTGFGYKVRFFNLQPDVAKDKRVLFDGGRDPIPQARINDQPWQMPPPSSAVFDGMLTLIYPPAGGVAVTRTVYPSMTRALVVEEWQVRNATDKPISVAVAAGEKVSKSPGDVLATWTCPGRQAVSLKGG